MSALTAAERRKTAGTICAYCGNSKLTGRQRPEHPIPAALRSAITVFTACDDCNARAGSGVDQPWLDHTLVRETRHRLRVVDPRRPGREVPHPLLAGGFEDERGHRVVVRDGQPSYPGSVVRDGDRIQISAGIEERAEELLERVKRQLAEEGKEVGSMTWSPRIRTRPTLTRGVSDSLTTGVRMGAKLALAFGAEAFDETWRGSPAAEQLRKWLWSVEPTDFEGVPLAWIPSNRGDHPLAQPPNHLVYFDTLKDTPHLTALICGELGFAVPVGPPGSRAPNTAWRSGPAHGSKIVTTYDEILIDAVRRHPSFSGRSK